jgi:hypothetical protein
MNDILVDLKIWLERFHADAPHRQGRMPEINIDLVIGALAEIQRLRVATGKDSIVKRAAGRGWSVRGRKAPRRSQRVVRDQC